MKTPIRPHHVVSLTLILSIIGALVYMTFSSKQPATAELFPSVSVASVSAPILIAHGGGGGGFSGGGGGGFSGGGGGGFSGGGGGGGGGFHGGGGGGGGFHGGGGGGGGGGIPHGPSGGGGIPHGPSGGGGIPHGPSGGGGIPHGPTGGGHDHDHDGGHGPWHNPTEPWPPTQPWPPSGGNPGGDDGSQPQPPISYLVFDGSTAQATLDAFDSVTVKPKDMETDKVKKGFLDIFHPGSVSRMYSHEQLPSLLVLNNEVRALLVSLTNVDLTTQEQFDTLFKDLQWEIAAPGSPFIFCYAQPASAPAVLQGTKVAEQVPQEFAKRWHEELDGSNRMAIVEAGPDTALDQMKALAQKVNDAAMSHKKAHSSVENLVEVYLDTYGWHDSAIKAEYVQRKVDMTTPCIIMLDARGNVVGRLGADATSEQIQALIDKANN